MARRKESSGSDPTNTKPRVHVTANGGRYVQADELLSDPEVKKKIDLMAQIASEDSGMQSPDTSSEGPETSA